MNNNCDFVEAMELEAAACPLCERDDCVPIAVGEDFEYRTCSEEFLAVQCRQCSLVYLNPRPAPRELRRIYPDNYHAFQFENESKGLVYRVRRRLEWKRLSAWCRDLPAEARILDIGCGDGFHIGLLKEFGPKTWSIEGVDADPRAQSGSGDRGLTIHCGQVEEIALPETSYDLILMIMTIEHLADPLRTLRRAYTLLRPGGRLAIVTDNFGSPDFRIFGNRHWGGYHFPRHFYLFDKKTLHRIGAKAGFEIESIRTALSPVNWTYSVRNWIDDWKGPKWMVRFFSLRSPVALGIFTMLDLPLSWMGRGAILHGLFRKPTVENGRAL